jgi:outer membrane protein assembly factor BamB
MRRRILIAVAAVLVVAIGLGAAYALRLHSQEADVRGSSTVEFIPIEVPQLKPEEPGVMWPMWGRDEARLRVAAGVSLGPPFRRVWMFRARSLVEFPPTIAYGRLFFANNTGVVYAISAKTGKRAWRYESHRCQAMSPAVDDHLIFATFLNKPPCNATGDQLTGQIVALKAGSGGVVWRKTIGPSESSPLVRNGSVFVGDWRGYVYRFAEADGRLIWRFQADGKVKGGVAFSGGRIFFGTYGHKVYALDARTGKEIWTAEAQPRFGSQGTFYATPAVAYGRVYIGATDGKVYSFGAKTGELRWSQSTGGYVYSSAAVWRKRVYVGSYSHWFYCLDAATGDVLWKFEANGPISGSPTIVAGRVYFSTLEQRTYALDARTGKSLWTFPDGKYTPVVAEPGRIYLTGYTRIYALVKRR